MYEFVEKGFKRKARIRQKAHTADVMPLRSERIYTLSLSLSLSLSPILSACEAQNVVSFRGWQHSSKYLFKYLVFNAEPTAQFTS